MKWSEFDLLERLFACCEIAEFTGKKIESLYLTKEDYQYLKKKMKKYIYPNSDGEYSRFRGIPIKIIKEK